MLPGVSASGRIVAAMKRLGFDRVYDTAYSADLTVIEEATEFLRRKASGGKLPLFTSCCPGWVKFAEQYFPELLPNLSSTIIIFVPLMLANAILLEAALSFLGAGVQPPVPDGNDEVGVGEAQSAG